MKQSIMPLGRLPRGGRGRIRHIDGDGDALRRLTELGFVAGKHIQVIQSSTHGPLIVAFGQGKVILDKAVSLSVMVEVIE